MKTERIFMKSYVIFALAMLVIGMPQVLRLYMPLSDLVTGFITGVGLGLMLVALLKRKKGD